jgi:small subunit ribosomal protein S1
MSSNHERHDYTVPPPSLDEGYWSSLLADGEYAAPQHEEDIEAEDGGSAHSDSTDPYYPELYTPDEADWVEIQRILDNDMVIDLPVIGYNRGGLLVEWRTLRGFVPASQLLNFPAHLHDGVRRRALMSRVGQALPLRVIELNPEKNRLILSERAAQVGPGTRAHLLTHIEPGSIVSGTVTNLCDFGAFVDLGGLEGLIHISELSWGRVAHPETLLKRGAVVEAYVLDVDRDSARIALSVKRLHPDPWQTVETRYAVGQVVAGVITNVVDFGAFACIEEGLEGLIHVSELAEGHFLHPRNVVAEGQMVEARILNIDGKARRLGLSLRLLE